MTDDPRRTAFDAAAPPDERTDALRTLHRTYMPGASDILPADTVRELARDIEMLKAAEIIQFPGHRTRPPARAVRGMRSVDLDQLEVASQGDWYDPPAILSPEMARRVVDQTPILSAVIMTRQRQISRFCAPSEDDGLGFAIRHIDPEHELTEEERSSIHRLTRFFQHSGWEWRPRHRRALGRDSFSAFMAKLVRDTLTLDRAAIEVEAKRDPSLGIDGLYAVDGATIRLCVPGVGYQGDPDIYALQVIQGRVTTTYTADSLILEARNPRADVRYGDYGFSELELLVQTITGWLNAMSLNAAGFQKNHIPRGVLHLFGDYSDAQIVEFKRYWQSMLSGANAAFTLPIMVSRDPQGKAQFERFGVEFNEMYFSKWMTFLTSVICAVYSMDPSEINFESFTNGTSSLSGDDTEEKLAASKDKGLRPLLSYFENLFTDYVVQEFGDKYCFRWIGLDPKDEAREWEARKLVMTVDEQRARLGLTPHENEIIGGAPLNPSLIGLYQMAAMPQGQDFGSAPDFGDYGGEGGEGDDQQQDAGTAGEDPPRPGEEDGPPGRPTAGPRPGEQAPPPDAEGPDFGKALPPVYRIGD